MTQGQDALATTLREQADRIDSCRQADVADAKQTFAAAMRQVIAARNTWMRADDPQREGTLRRMNALLSLMSSIEFPLSGLHRERMDAVTREMRAVRDAIAA